MGKEGIRYAAKVELNKDASTLPYLHVRFPPKRTSTLMSHPPPSPQCQSANIMFHGDWGSLEPLASR